MSDACGLVRLLRPAPRTDHSSLPPELWLEIFRYATYVPRVRGLSPGDPFEPQRPSNYAWGVNTLSRHSRQSETSSSSAGPVAAILSLLPNLHVLSGIWERPLAKNLLEVFSRYLTSSIQGLYWDEGLVPEGEPSLLSAAFLPKYQSLRVLDIRKLRLEDPDSFPTDTTSTISLPSVVDLLLPTCPAVLGFARKLDLPRLNRLVLDAANLRRNSSSYVSSSLNKLLARHGPKITTLELLPMTSLSYQASPISITTFLQPDVCPALETFVFDCRERLLSACSPPPSCLPSSPARPGVDTRPPPSAPPTPSRNAPEPELRSPHRNLRRIGIRGMGISRLYPNRPSHAQAHLQSFLKHRALFPVLETVRTLGFLVDACTDPFARDIFIWWTEKFEEHGLDLQDGEGVVWLYTDPVDGRQDVVVEEEIVADDCASLVHKSDAGEVQAVKA
ncbi:uncharacterized protein B0H18DRAFT_1122131 [Fomitopsis serialis]|uniref:uncharacterized protein n=1 Tax=Fomitopsis serialis TaxID=139415 RepID=UPI002007D3FF|nr:uncharacterized protein B0H18DRAFT_1122131 [Neoantrodia serialis]KAH9920171.1 hypothetical protein B0H18DRAFT_1122131 [Neoantrodia serialis]